MCDTLPLDNVHKQTKLGNKTALGKAEFDALVTEMSGTAFSKELVADLFSVFDKSGNGTISINELKSHVSEAMATGLITDAELKLMTKGVTRYRIFETHNVLVQDSTQDGARVPSMICSVTHALSNVDHFLQRTESTFSLKRILMQYFVVYICSHLHDIVVPDVSMVRLT